ncbi:drug resistance transporter, EmrB/QacA subfamily [Nonomuraea maritima]|uniref:Drug resistance transporter, EmrB/QacA subfamily n=1 Tax=Nonomuraea maritima TaxID=683260 RepID=A0A1G9RPE7_9ACTN|nr:MFS transporter [Nonomuraea maritima]SDM24827.1 drug resistance transporter, EmrB/QacA subfamily [Nonomuraea maritima]
MTSAVRAEVREAASAEPMTHRQIMEALSGLLLGLFVAILSATVVSNALPTIIAELHATETTYTWVITAELLATTIATPIWGKLADLVSKKVLVQLGLIIYVFGSALGGLAQNPATLIGARVIQGIGVGGLTALVQVIMAAMISPRERGRYSGYIGATFALATVAGPLIGGLIVDTSWLGWRWCFYVGVPFAVIALIVLQKTLRLPVVKRDVSIDWAGAVLFSAATSLILIWVSFAGVDFDWLSWQTSAMVGGTLLLTAIFILVEMRTKEPLVPLRLFANRAISLSVVASLLVGVGLYGVTTFLSQYFQLARGESPTHAGILTLPLIVGLAVTSTVVGLVISRTGRYKIFLILGGLFLTAGFLLASTLRYDTDYWLAALFMVLIGIGVGMTMQNLVLAVQNQVRLSDLGAASSVVVFFRTLGGTAGVAALGAVLANRVAEYTTDGLEKLGVKGGGAATDGSIPKLSELPKPVREVVQSAFGHGVGDLFLYAAPLAVLSLIVVLFIKEVPLRTSTDAPAAEAATPSEQPATSGRHAQRQLSEPDLVAVAADTGRTQPSASNGLPVRVPNVAHASVAGPQPIDLGGTGVRGFVRGGDGAPVPHANLTLIDVRGHQLGRTVAQADGYYQVATPGSGTYVLIASAAERDPQVATLVVGDAPLDFDLVLAGSGRLTGTVRDLAGNPVAQAMVIVTDVRGEVVTTGLTTADGMYGFSGVVAGTYTVTVSAGTHRPVALLVEVGTGQTTQDVILQPAARIRGTILLKGADRPLADARVTLLDASGNVVATATTGEDGEYAFADLPGGQYTVIATGYPPVASAVTLTGQGDDDHDIRLGHSE